MTGAVLASLVSTFASVTNTYDTGTAANETIPTGASDVRIRLVGGGGGGAQAVGNLGGGGGGGGGVELVSSVSPSEWGTNLVYTVGVAGSNETANGANNAAAGGNSTVGGNVGGAAITLTASGGALTNGTLGAAGGGATGGTTNVSGSTGTAGNPGVGGAAGIDVGNNRGRGGDGGGDGTPGAQPIAGRIIFTWL